ncbi:MAG: FAD-binding and (Fe-S)-binding domain-containing protein, partial [Candidatus Thermoplasmatota archaeon]
MDLLELALNPRKAKSRMSPFVDALPPGQVRKLEYYFGDRATDDPAERVLYSRDASTPSSALKRLLKRDAWAVVRPQVRGELLELIEFATRNGVPIVPRGAGTSSYGGSVPTEGGVVVDLRGFNKILKIDKAEKTVLVEANATFKNVEEALRANGLALRQYPTSMHAATVAGWLCQGGGGIGSLKYGPFISDVSEVLLLAPDGQLRRLAGDELQLVDSTFGTAGFIIEVKLRVREAKVEKTWLGTFDDAQQARLACRRIALECGAWNVILITPQYAEMVNAAAEAKLLPNKDAVLVTFESGDDAKAIDLAKAIITSSSGLVAKDADAQKAWDNRFNHLSLKRLGPSVIVAETAVDVEKLGAGIDAVGGANKAERWCVWAIAISPREFDIIYYALDNEHRGTYSLATGNAIAVIDAVKKIGGRSYSTGVLASDESEHVLGKDRLKAMKAWRKKTDKKEIFNPGAVTGARTRLMPLPVHDFPLRLKLAGPLLKLRRGWFEYNGSDTQWLAQQRALGRVHAGDLGELATEVTTCTFCGMCNAVAPEAKSTPWESATPRGRVQLAKAVIEGRATISPRALRNVAWTSLQHNADSICPTAIPIQRVTDHLIAAGVETNGALPEHLGFAESYEANGNPFGQPKDKRGAWVNVAFDAISTSIFMADDAAAYNAPEVAQSAATVLATGGFPVGHMGKSDAGSAAVLFETGQRAAAEKAIMPFLEALAKRGATTIITPDANGARVMALDWPLICKKNEVTVPQV